MRFVLSAAERIGAALSRKDSWHLVVLSSTVMPGSTGGPLLQALEARSGKKCGADFGLCYNPEFIALGSVIRDRCGNVDKVLVVSRDVTERKRVEEVLQRSEERFRALIENSSDAIALLNPEGIVLYAGPSTDRVIGYSLEEFVGRRLFDMIHPDDVERTIKLLNELLRHRGQAVHIECRIQNRGGLWR